MLCIFCCHGRWVQTAPQPAFILKCFVWLLASAAAAPAFRVSTLLSRHLSGLCISKHLAWACWVDCLKKKATTSAMAPYTRQQRRTLDSAWTKAGALWSESFASTWGASTRYQKHKYIIYIIRTYYHHLYMVIVSDRQQQLQSYSDVEGDGNSIMVFRDVWHVTFGSLAVRHSASSQEGLLNS